MKISTVPMALIEGEPHWYHEIVPENGKWVERWVQYEEGDLPEEADIKEAWDGQEPETDTYYMEGKEEYYDYETVCKACGTRFMAYKDDKEWERVRNFCPGCGKKLATEA